MTKVIEKKILPEYFELVLSDKKHYDVRLNDFDITEGDTLVLREWNKEEGDYTGREVKTIVGYIGKIDINNDSVWSKEEIEQHGLQIISFDKV